MTRKKSERDVAVGFVGRFQGSMRGKQIIPKTRTDSFRRANYGPESRCIPFFFGWKLVLQLYLMAKDSKFSEVRIKVYTGGRPTGFSMTVVVIFLFLLLESQYVWILCLTIVSGAIFRIFNEWGMGSPFSCLKFCNHRWTKVPWWFLCLIRHHFRFFLP